MFGVLAGTCGQVISLTVLMGCSDVNAVSAVQGIQDATVASYFAMLSCLTTFRRGRKINPYTLQDIRGNSISSLKRLDR